MIIPIDIEKITLELNNNFVNNLNLIQNLINNRNVKDAELEISKLITILQNENKLELYLTKINSLKNQILCSKCDLALNKDYKSSKYILNLLNQSSSNTNNCFESSAQTNLINNLTDFEYFLSNNVTTNLIGDKIFEIYSTNIFNSIEGNLVSQFLTDSLIEVETQIILPLENDNIAPTRLQNKYILKHEFIAQSSDTTIDENKFLIEFINNPEDLIKNKQVFGNKKEIAITIYKIVDINEDDTEFTISRYLTFYFKLVADKRYILRKRIYKISKEIKKESNDTL